MSLAIIIFYILKINTFDRYLGFLFLSLQVGLDLAITINVLSLSVMADNPKKLLLKIFGWSFFFAAIADGMYNYFVNIEGSINYTIVSSIFEIPFLLFLFLQFVAWLLLFSKEYKELYDKRFYLHIPFIISAVLIVAIFIGCIDWKINIFSLNGIYQVFDTVLESLCVALISLCLVTIRSRPLFYISLGFLIVISTDFLIRINVIEQTLTQNSLFEASWVIGLLLILFGFSKFKSNELKGNSEKWFCQINSIQSYIALWNFILCLILIVFFGLIISYLSWFSINSLIKYIPSCMIILTVLTIILSVYFTKIMLAPLKNIEDIIKNFTNNHEIINSNFMYYDYGIFEYGELYKFLTNSLVLWNEKISAEIKLSSLAASVAHDIRSPLAAIEMTISSISNKVPDLQKNILKEAAQNVRDIANNLLIRFQQGSAENREFSSEYEEDNLVILADLLEQVVSQKRIEWQDNTVNLIMNTEDLTQFKWILASSNGIKRILSNLLNNAYESLSNKREIKIHLGVEKNLLKLVIEDDGCGIPENKISEVLNGASTKHVGKGLGLSGAKSFIENMQGKLIIDSIIDKGTKVILYFPYIQSPKWFPDSIVIEKNTIVIILDDDINTHSFWRERLQQYQIHLYHFQTPKELLEWRLNKPNLLDESIYLIAHKLHDNSYDGFALLKQVDASKGSFLIVDQLDCKTLQLECEKIGIWLMPKKLMTIIPVSLKE